MEKDIHEPHTQMTNGAYPVVIRPTKLRPEIIAIRVEPWLAFKPLRVA
jgi:hypothetical protein